MEKNPFGVELPSQFEMLKSEIDQTQINSGENLNWPRRICRYMDSPDPWPAMIGTFKESSLIRVSR